MLVNTNPLFQFIYVHSLRTFIQIRYMIRCDISKISVEEYVNMFKEYYDKISKLLGITKVDVNEELKIYNSITSS